MNKTKKRMSQKTKSRKTRGKARTRGGAASEGGAASGASEPQFKSKFPPLSTPLERTQKNYESANQWQSRLNRINRY